MKKSILATIYFTIDKRHTDYNCMLPYPSEIYVNSFTDVYYFDTDYIGNITRADMENYAKNDLKLVAGGGYDCKHIHNVRFEFSTNQRDIDDFKRKIKAI